MASAGRTLGRRVRLSLGRDGFRFLGRTRTATKSLKGRLAEAQPPGATMAVTGKQLITRYLGSKDEAGERLTIFVAFELRFASQTRAAGHIIPRGGTHDVPQIPTGRMRNRRRCLARSVCPRPAGYECGSGSRPADQRGWIHLHATISLPAKHRWTGRPDDTVSAAQDHR